VFHANHDAQQIFTFQGESVRSFSFDITSCILCESKSFFVAWVPSRTSLCAMVSANIQCALKTVSRSCNGASSTDTIVCLPCTERCEFGFFKSGTCDGTGVRDTITCLPCTASCPVSSYLDGECDGTSTWDSITCSSCQNACEPGQYITNMCNGSSTSDTTECRDCQDCGELITIGTCDGKGMTDTQTCTSCLCSPGQYMSKPCTGTNTEPGTHQFVTFCKAKCKFAQCMSKLTLFVVRLPRLQIVVCPRSTDWSEFLVA
jgi:hypothetical protein